MASVNASTQYNTVGGKSAQTSNLPAGSTPLSRELPPFDKAREAANIQFPDLDPSILQAAQVTLTSAQILALHTTPITLVAAQGAGTIVEVVAVHSKLVFNANAYTGANAMEVRYTDGSGAKASADIPSAFVDSASGTNYNVSKSTGTSITPVANAAIVAAVPVANPAAGDSTIVMTVLYRVLTP